MRHRDKRRVMAPLPLAVMSIGIGGLVREVQAIDGIAQRIEDRGSEILRDALGDDALGASIGKRDLDGCGRAGGEVAGRRCRLRDGGGDGGGAGLLRGDGVGWWG